MLNYHFKFAFGIRKYFRSFSGLEERSSAPFSEAEWRAAAQLNFGKTLSNEAAVPLRSVFQFLKTGSTEGGMVFPYAPLSLDKANFFPLESESGDFATLEAGFTAEWDKVKKSTPEAVGETLLFLAKKYLSKVGCSPEMPHISAFEHIKTTAALAECLERGKNGGILLVTAGLDGIQSFCYDIIRNRAARSMKGRSFFLQMMLDALAHAIVSHSDIKVSSGNIIYARGGKIYLLLPDNDKVKTALTQIKNQARSKLWADDKAGLFLYFESVTFKSGTSDLNQTWNELDGQVRQSKSRKFNSELTPHFDKLFVPQPEGFDAADARNGKKQICSVTGETIQVAGKNDWNSMLNDAEVLFSPTVEPIWVKKIVKTQANIASELNDAKRIAIDTSGEKDWFEPIGTTPKVGLLTEGETAPATAFIRCLNDPVNFLEFNAHGFSFYGGNEQAKKGDGDLKEYSELVGIESLEDLHKGFHRLGVARLDLDGLGSIVHNVRQSFAANASLSLQLDIFLSGYVNTIRKKLENDGSQYLNILFSGGDDMLVVGRWNVVLDFIEEIRTDFRHFIGNDDFCTISAGVVLVTPKFPIGKATENAGIALQAAKEFSNGKKNAITFLGETLSWEKEFEAVKNIKARLFDLLTDGKISAAFLQRLMQLQVIKNKHLTDSRLKDKPDLSYRWQTAWQFAKLRERYPELKILLDKMTTELFLSERNYDLYALAARWTELERRAMDNN